MWVANPDLSKIGQEKLGVKKFRDIGDAAFSILGRHVARAEETAMVCDGVEQWLSEAQPGKETFIPTPIPDSAEGWFAALYVGVFEMGITFVLWLMAIRLAPRSDRISNLVFLAPFLNLVFASQVLGEKIYLTTVGGIILLVAGIN